MKKYRCPHCNKWCISTFNKITPGLYGLPIKGSVKSGSECPNCGGRFVAVPKKTKLSKFLFFTITFLPYICAIILIFFPKLRFLSVMGLFVYFFLYILLILPIYNFFFTSIEPIDYY